VTEPWLLKVGLGGVQELIAQATKVRELAAGSRIISRAARAAGAAAAAAGAEIVLPASIDAAHCPHQIVALVPGATRDQATAVARSMAEAARASWLTLAKDQLAQLRPPFEPLPEPEALRAQLEQALEIYWVALPLGPDYREAFADLLGAFENRRWSRTFPQLAGFSAHPTWCCSQCGVRPAVLQPPSAGWPEDRHFATGRERLCGVCAAKRRRSSVGAYPSTHRLARSRFLRDPSFAPLRAELRRIDSGAPAGASDGEGAPVAIEERLLDDLDEIRQQIEAGRARGVPAADLAGRGARRMAESAYAAPFRSHPELVERLFRLSPYYALVVCDGDRMGEWLSGDHFPPGSDLRAAQDRLSRALLDFAQAIVRLIEPYADAGARLIYAGGDDGLLVVPLDFLLPLCAAIGKRWHDLQEVVRRLAAADHGAPTLSLHASLVHAKAPLQPAVRRLHELLERAKERGGRDCVSILCAIHSGPEAQWLGDWRELDMLSAAVEAFSNWRRADIALPAPAELERRRGEGLPARLLYSALDAARSFLGSGMPVAAFGRELDRLTAQSASGHEDSPGWAAAKAWFFERATYRGRGSPRLEGPEAFATALETVAFLARELAWEDAP
jgi:CRISPR-associated protein Cmr2